MNKNAPWDTVVGLVSELEKCDTNNIPTAAIAMAYICIDTFYSLARPQNKVWATRSDFIDWVNQFLKGHPDQPYKYRGKDVYAARCAFLHTYGSEAQLHEQNPDLIKFAYHNGGKHAYNPEIDPTLAIIGTRSFINDVILAGRTFMDECRSNALLRNRVEDVFLMYSNLFHSLHKKTKNKPSL
ncbi:hypothetical protein [Marispirochaeta sp.]|uniref:hypothetical protein n=1 Tax=Marispirochaeta sp. TaxID=2038653 RepID=UPI0029C7170F|nr:hypothetical protein [Marispirochaeta sp.]